MFMIAVIQIKALQRQQTVNILMLTEWAVKFTMRS